MNNSKTVWWISILFFVGFLLPQELHAFSPAALCGKVAARLAGRTPSDYARDKIQITQTGNTFSTSSEITGPDFKIAGQVVPNRYSLPTRNIHGLVYRILETVATPEGNQYWALGRDFHKDTHKGWKGEQELAGLDENQRRDALRLENGYTYDDVWQAALLYPKWMKTYQIHADRDVMVLPTLPALNKIADSLEGTPNAIGQRFVEYHTLTNEGQKYSARKFFNYFVDGKILMGTKDEFSRHDLTNDHIIGGLMVPKPLFERFRSQALIAQALENDPVIKSLPDPKLKKMVEDLAKRSEGHFAHFWDDATSRLSQTVPGIERNGRVPLLGPEAASRSALYRLLCGESLSESEQKLLPRRDSGELLSFQELTYAVDASHEIRRALKGSTDPESAKVLARLAQLEAKFGLRQLSADEISAQVASKLQ